jgi:hypothetical protein
MFHRRRAQRRGSQQTQRKNGIQELRRRGRAATVQLCFFAECNNPAAQKPQKRRLVAISKKQYVKHGYDSVCSRPLARGPFFRVSHEGPSVTELPPPTPQFEPKSGVHSILYRVDLPCLSVSVPVNLTWPPVEVATPLLFSLDEI